MARKAQARRPSPGYPDGMRTKVLLLLAACLSAPPALLASEVATPRHEERCILAAVAGRMGATLTSAYPPPAVFYASRTELSRFQAAVRTEYGDEAAANYSAITNMFLPKQNVIFLSDKAVFYLRGRFIDDSVAHEFAHYIQYYYKGEKDNPNSDQDQLETEAVRVQDWFRETFMAAGVSPCSAR